MTYSISIYRRELSGSAGAFEENVKTIPLFTAAEQKRLRTVLEERGYTAKKKVYGHFAYPDIQARLSDRSLTLSSSSDQEAIFTILELGSELAMDKSFALWNPQDGTWIPKAKKAKKAAAKKKKKTK